MVGRLASSLQHLEHFGYLNPHLPRAQSHLHRWHLVETFWRTSGISWTQRTNVSNGGLTCRSSKFINWNNKSMRNESTSLKCSVRYLFKVSCDPNPVTLLRSLRDIALCSVQLHQASWCNSSIAACRNILPSGSSYIWERCTTELFNRSVMIDVWSSPHLAHTVKESSRLHEINVFM